MNKNLRYMVNIYAIYEAVSFPPKGQSSNLVKFESAAAQTIHNYNCELIIVDSYRNHTSPMMTHMKWYDFRPKMAELCKSIAFCNGMEWRYRTAEVLINYYTVFVITH